MKHTIVAMLNILQLTLFFIFWYIYTKYDRKIGVYLAVLSFFLGNLLIYSSEFGAAEMTKVVFVSITSFLLFLSLNYTCIAPFVNQILTWLVRLNIGIMGFAIDNMLLRVVLFFVALTTPYFTVKTGKLHTDTSFIDKDIWVVLYTFAFLWFNNTHAIFSKSNNHVYFTFTLLLPMIFHFISNQFLEARAMSLCVLLAIHPFITDKAIRNFYPIRLNIPTLSFHSPLSSI